MGAIDDIVRTLGGPGLVPAGPPRSFDSKRQTCLRLPRGGRHGFLDRRLGDRRDPAHPAAHAGAPARKSAA